MNKNTGKITETSGYPAHLCLHEIFAQRVNEQPNAIALIHRDEQLTYAELDRRSTQLAQHLLTLGLQPEQFVAVCMERSFEMLIGIFAILKAGGAYVPIDVDYPEERLRFMVEDSAAQIVLTQQSLVAKLPQTVQHTIELNSSFLDQLVDAETATTNYQLPTTNCKQLAYCIYTSGSTGKPKGVMITHENLVYQLQGQHAIAPAPIGKMILTCSISFDVSVLTIFWTLLSGAPLLIPEQGEEKDIGRLLQLIEKEAVTHILTLPSLHTLIVEHATPQQLQSVQLVNVSGEVCPTSLTQKHAAVCPNGQLYNLYGPTEATINCTYFTIPTGYDEPKVPIGKPIENYELFILNERLQEVPQGEVGEIYIGGCHPVVGRGYWNRPQLSAERFIKNPHQATRGGATLYKTGDLARWQTDGNIEFLGRADYQVKFRGYRIELGEIETAISNHPQVKETVVLLKNPHDYGKQKLVAYVTRGQESGGRSQPARAACASSPTDAFNVTLLRDFLAQSLPDYMLPSQFVFLEKMPLTTNGKFDRKALPEPPQERPILAQAYAAPQGELEQYLTTIWEQLLQLSPIGRHDKFFELGGNSIQAAQFIGRLSQQLDTSIFVTTIFDKPTIATYAQMLQTNYANEVKLLFKKDAKKVDNQQVSNEVAANRPPSTIHRQPSKLTKYEIENFQKYIPKIPKYATLEPSTVHRPPSTVKNKPAIFILAPPRSGTTLLRVMLAGHPDLFAANELQLLGFNDLTERSAAYQGKFKLWSEGLIRAVMELQEMTADEAKDLLHRYEKAGYTTKEVYRQIQDWIGDLILVDKSPSYALDPDVLQRAELDFDNALYIHLVRHPYTMVNSLEKYHLDQVLYLEPHNYPARELGELVWLHSHRNIVQFLKNIPAHRQFRLRYEDLVADPERSMDELCQTLGLPFHEGLLTPYADLDGKMMDGIYADSRSMGDTNLLKQKTINATKAEQWKQVFKDNFLSDESWDWTEYFGYVGDVKGGNGKLGDTTFFTPPPIEHVFNKNANSLNINGLKRDKATNPPIAIVGMACRLPGADSPEAFWENLVNGVDVSQPIAPEDLEKVGLDIEKFKQKNWVRRRLMLDDPDQFDAAFFGYSPQEAKLMDPQQRVFLEVAYHALENAGYDPYTYAGRIGIFGGVARNAYFTNNVATDPKRLASAGEYLDMLGYEKNFSVTRVAYKLNLRGPAVNVQTACSSTGVGVHLACQSIWQGDSDMVLVGGGRIQPDLQAGYEYTEGGPLSPDGYLRAFDANAQGMVKGNGMVFMVLKPLDQAMNDGDHIWATIKSTAINNDGSDKIGFTAPSVDGQAKAIAQAHQKAGITANEIDYIEAHGTGTLLGDPIEIQGLTKAFQQTTDKRQFCAIGSVKTNIGHLDAGACVAGMMKVALAMKYEILPANLNFERPNPQIDFKKSPFYVNATLQPWLRNGHVRRAGVSSFGLGGTNAHVILEEAPVTKPLPRERKNDTQVYLLSAKTETALTKVEQNLLRHLDEHPLESRTNLSYTLAVGRAQLAHRKVLITDGANLLKVSSVQTTSKLLPNHLQTTFIFPGGGAQYVNMARDLYYENYAFRQIVDRCFDYLERHEKLALKPLIFPDSEITNLHHYELEKPSRALPALFTIEYALAELWKSWGVQPTELIGHSMGEYTAACLAGVMTWKEALGLVSLRGRLFEQLPAAGAMLSVALSENKLKKYLTPTLSIAVINKADACVVSGTTGAIDILKERLEKAGIEAKRIRISVAAHSAQIDPILPEFRTYLETVNFKKPTLPFISNTTGDWAKPEAVVTPDYWVNHIRQTVRFADGLGQILQNDNRILIEVGPGQTLATFARQHPNKNETHQIFASVRHPKEQRQDVVFLYKTLAKLWTQGYPIDWEGFFKPKNTRRVPLPTYPFERKRFWIAPQRTSNNGQYFQPIAQVKSNEVSTPNVKAERQLESVARPLVPPIQPPQQSPKQLLIREIQAMLTDMSGYEAEDLAADATFLELGFDSLFLSQVVIQFNKKFAQELSFRQLFEEESTIELLANYGLANGAEASLPVNTGAQTFLSVNTGTQTPMSVNANDPQQDGLPLPQAGMPVLQSFPQAGMPALPTNDLQTLFAQQIAIMQQQLAILTANGGRWTVDGNALRTTTEPPSNHFQTTSKPKKKGVTSKLKNYGKRGNSTELTEQQRAYITDFTDRYVAKTLKSKELAKKHRLYYADPRTLSGFNKNWKEIVYQIASERSKGSRFWDIDDNEYLDFVMSYGVALFGHSPDFIMDAVREQLAKGTGLDTLTPLATEVAQIICELSNMDRMTLANTGTEAVVGAVRAARAATGRDKIIIFDTDYHGLTDEFMLRGITVRGNTKAVPLAPGIPKAVQDSVVILDWDDPKIIEKIRFHAQDLAAVLVEPVQAQNPHWQHDEILHEIRKVTRELDVALIFDEVINGFRLLQGGAQAWFGIEADLVAYGKTISGGLPCAAFAGKHKYMDVFDGGIWQFGDDSAPEAMPTYFAGTFIKNPVSVAAALAAMREIQRRGKELQLELNAKTVRFAGQLRDLFLRLQAPIFIQSTSSIFTVKFADKNPTNALFYSILRYHGVNMRARPCFVSTAHTEEDFQRALQLVEKTLQEMLDNGLMERYTGEDLNDIYTTSAGRETRELTSFQEKLPSNRKESKLPLANLQVNENGILQRAEVVQTNVTKPTDKNGCVPLTEGQQEIFLNHQFSPEAAKAYNIATEIKLMGRLNLNAFKTAIQLLIQRHEALRTTISADGKTQTILRERPLPIELADLSTDKPRVQKMTLAEYRVDTMEQAFDLQNDALSRWQLFKLEEEEYVLFLTVHHIICDGWSLGILTRELGELYARECGLEHQNLAEAKQLSTYAQESAAFTHSTVFDKNQQYWLNQFADGVPTVEIPTDFKRPPLKTYSGSTQKINFSENLTQQLRKAAAQQGTTLYVYFLTAFATFLHRWSNEEDLILGVAAAGHNLPNNGSVVGHLINLLPVRLKVGENDTFAQQIKRTRGQILDAFDHQQYTFGTLVRELKVQRDSSRNALISVAFNMDSPLNDLNYGNVLATTMGVAHRYETFDIFINLKPIGKTIDFEWNFNTDLFQKELIAYRLEEFKTLLESALQTPDSAISALNILPKTELNLIKNWSAGTTKKYPIDQTLHRLMSRQAAWTPDKVAFVFEQNELTFGELETRSDQLAYYLLGKGLTPKSFVGLCLNRSLDMVVAMFAILKTGCAYVPIDPRNPQERIEMLLRDADCQALLTTSDLATDLLNLQDLVNLKLGTIKVDVLHFRNLANRALPQTQGTDNAYVIYTSGSTGKPKGVVVRHESAINTLFAINEHLQMGADDTMYSVSSMAFDMSIPDYFLAPTVGATLVLAGDATKKDGFLLKEEFERYRPTVMQATPTTWKMLLLTGWTGDKNLTAVAGGEGFPKETARQLMESCKAVYNGYGPTEATIYTTYKKITEEHLAKEAFGEFVAIGQPINNFMTLILDKKMRLVPIGVAGELHIGGIGLSNEYLKRPALTAEKFVDSPYGKLYKTGDRVRYLANGDIDFLGRIDTQVKIRGYRIELGEIEEVLQQHVAVSQAAVKVIYDAKQNPQLVGYFIKKEAQEVLNAGNVANLNERELADELRTFLRSKLPGFMVPKFFVEMKEFPLTTSLKVDRKKLPAPVIESQQQYSKPQTLNEKLVADLFTQLLDTEQVGVKDNFFELGGHSLVAVELMAKIHQQTGHQLPLTTLFQHSTVQQLAVILDQQKAVVKSRFTSLIPIRATGTKAPIYLVHGGGLHVLFYQTLVQHLGEDQPVYALQARGLNGDEEPLDRIEDMAAHYLSEIQQLNPDGPYHFAGYSLGGLIAWEMAKQVRAQGKEIGLLALFDAVAKEATMNGVNSNWSKKINKATYNLKLFATRPGRAFKYKKHVLNMRYQHLKGKLNIAYRDNQTGKIEESHLPYGKEVYEKSLVAFDKYQLAPVDVKVNLFKAAEQMFYLKDPEYLGWDKFAERGVETHAVPGDHLTLFDAPNDQIIGEILRGLME